ARIAPAAGELPPREVVHVFDDRVPALLAREPRVRCVLIRDQPGEIAHLRRRHLMAVDAIHDELGLPSTISDAGEPRGRRCDVRLVRARTSNQAEDRKSTRLNSSHVKISYAVFCLKKKNYTGILIRSFAPGYST